MINNIPEIGPVSHIDSHLLTEPIHLHVANKALPFAIDPSATEADLPALMSAIINFRSLSFPEFKLRTQDAVQAANYAWEELSFESHPLLRRRDDSWEVAWHCGDLFICLVDGNRHPIVQA